MSVPYWIALFFLSLGLALGLSYGSIDLAVLPALSGLVCAAVLVRREAYWQRTVGHVMFCGLAITLLMDFAPGLNSATAIADVVQSEGASPLTMRMSLDKPLLGLWVLLACSWVVVLRRKGVLMTLAVIRPLTALACLGGAWVLGLIAWAPNWPDHNLFWLLIKLPLVVLTAELLFRAYIQGGLERLLKHKGLALGISALLFGLSNLGAGWQWFGLSTAEGVGYGLAYRYGGLLVAVWCHLFVQVMHFVAFAYPMLAPT